MSDNTTHIKVDKSLFINLFEINNIKNYIFQLIKTIDDSSDNKILELERKLERINNKRNNNIFIKFQNKFNNLSYGLQEFIINFFSLLIVPAIILIIPLAIAKWVDLGYQEQIDTLRTNIDKVRKFNINNHKSLISEKLSFLNSKLLNSKDEVCKKFAKDIINLKIKKFHELNLNIRKISSDISNLEKQGNISDADKATKREEFLNQIKKYNLLKKDIQKFLKDNLTQFTAVTLNNNIIGLANSEREEINESEKGKVDDSNTVDNSVTKFTNHTKNSKNLSQASTARLATKSNTTQDLSTSHTLGI